MSGNEVLRVHSWTDSLLVGAMPILSDTQFVGTLADIVGVYISPHEHALVLCSKAKHLKKTVAYPKEQAFKNQARADWLAFLEQIERQTPEDRVLHLICDNYATQRHPAVKIWLENRPRFKLHFMPFLASWIDMLDVFLHVRLALRREHGVLKSIPALISAIEAFTVAHASNPKPFAWVASAPSSPVSW